MIGKRSLNLLIPGALALSGFWACSGSHSSGDYDSDAFIADTLTHHARYLTISDIGGGTVLADIADPWNDGAFLGRYALVHRDSTIPDGLPEGTAVIRTPVERAAVYSSVHTGGIAELGALGSVCAVADPAYFPDGDTIHTLISEGKIVDLGPVQSPSAEKIVAAGTELVLRSPMQGVTAAPLPRSVVPVELADYLETTPIGRAEWILLLGELTGKRTEARQMFDGVIDRYSELVFKAGGSALPKPKVLTESEQSGVWYLPAGGSYMARMINDAGGVWPWADTEGSGSLPLSLEKVAERALDADVWLLRTFGYAASPKTLVAADSRYAAFKPVKEGTVYGCDTSVKPLYNELAFHPEYLLADYVAIFHPDVMPDYELRYFVRE
ncbi:MAG: ABC transporter substrate-binding protein [Bacteroidales bacterium]|nr:ABC transporter substrate-binding protein [Bacteroidales bacterium]